MQQATIINFTPRSSQSKQSLSQSARKVLSEFIIEMTSKNYRTTSYVKQYTDTVKYIKQFEDHKGASLFTDSISDDVLLEMIHFFKTKRLSQNTIKGIIEKIKSQLRKAGNYGYPVNSSYDEVFVKSADSTSVSLSMNEITRIYYYDDLTRKQKMIRDLFVVGCMTGLRYSDYSTLTIDNFQNKVIVKSTQKTGATVYIPMHPYVQEIYTRYRGQIPVGYSVSYFDRAIKQICQKIGINQSIPVIKTQGFETITTVKQKWELISSHTARRSFCSNALAAGDLSISQIMMITGHKSESCFFRYIKADKIANAHRVSASKMFQI